METNKIPNLLWGDLRAELIAYHQQLMDKYNDPKKAITPSNPYTHGRMPFNSYYTLDRTHGNACIVTQNGAITTVYAIPTEK